MSTTWTQPAQTLISEATTGWEGIWSLTYAAGFGALNLAMSVPLGVGVSISYAAMDFRDAQDELEWARPNLRATARAEARRSHWRPASKGSSVRRVRSEVGRRGGR